MEPGRCKQCRFPLDEKYLDYLGWCQDCVADPTCENARFNAERDDAAERKMAAKETARQDAEYRRTHDG